MATKEEILDAIGEMSVLELSELLKDFEDRGEGSADPAKRRSTLRFLNELYLVGIVPSIDPIVELLKSLVAEDEKTREFLGAADEREIIFVRGATEGINLVASSWGGTELSPGDEIVLTVMEHHSNIVPWQLIAERTGAVIKVVPIDNAGELIMDEFEKLLGPRTKMVAVTHVSNALGTVVDVATINRIAHNHGAVTLIDGCQAVPHMAVDVQALDADFYVFSGHKLYGPSGIGVLYGKSDLLNAMPPYQGGGEMINTVGFEGSTWAELPYKFEAGTPHIAGTIALGAAIDYVTGIGVERIAAHEGEL
mgnify:CR=1 FL=1